MTQTASLPGGGKAKRVVPDDVKRKKAVKGLKQQAKVGVCVCAVDIACVDLFVCVGHAHVAVSFA
jgi:hypothetical protein